MFSTSGRGWDKQDICSSEKASHMCASLAKCKEESREKRSYCLGFFSFRLLSVEKAWMREVKCYLCSQIASRGTTRHLTVHRSAKRTRQSQRELAERWQMQSRRTMVVGTNPRKEFPNGVIALSSEDSYNLFGTFSDVHCLVVKIHQANYWVSARHPWGMTC